MMLPLEEGAAMMTRALALLLMTITALGCLEPVSCPAIDAPLDECDPGPLTESTDVVAGLTEGDADTWYVSNTTEETVRLVAALFALTPEGFIDCPTDLGLLLTLQEVGANFEPLPDGLKLADGGDISSPCPRLEIDLLPRGNLALTVEALDTTETLSYSLSLRFK